MTDEVKEGMLRVISLDDEQIMDLIRGDPLMLTNALNERILLCNNMTREEVEEAIGNIVGEGNVVVLGRKLDG